MRYPALLTVVPLAFLGVFRPAEAAIFPILDTRELTVQSWAVVEAVPLDEIGPDGNAKEGLSKQVRFAVKNVFMGDGIQPESILEVSIGYRLDELWGERDTTIPRVIRAVLFLKSSDHIVISGVRYRDSEGRVLRPRGGDLGSPYMTPQEDLTWEELIERITVDIKQVEALFALKAIEDVHIRNEKLFDWIDQHRDEFWTREAGRRGWGSVEQDIFLWITAGRIPEDSWKAVRLRADIHPDWGWDWSADGNAFGSPEGRQLLLDIALDQTDSVRDRCLALCNLGATRDLWKMPGWKDSVSVTEEEQAEIIDRLIPLLFEKEPELRRYAVRAIHHASNPHDGALEDRLTTQALDDLTRAYRREPPGSVRNELARAIPWIGDESYWKTLTGNPARMIAVLTTPDVDDGYVTMSMSMVAPSDGKLYQHPAVVLENPAKPNESIILPQHVLEPPRDGWESGWGYSDGDIVIRIPVQWIVEGRWHIHVGGLAGKGGEMGVWRSEAQLLNLPVDGGEE